MYFHKKVGINLLERVVKNGAFYISNESMNDKISK